MHLVEDGRWLPARPSGYAQGCQSVIHSGCEAGATIKDACSKL